MRVFINNVLHKKEDKILKNLMDLKVFGNQDIETVKEKMFQLEKWGIRHPKIGWYRDKKRWVGPGKILPWFIPQFWLKPPAYLHDITFLILEEKPHNFDWMTLETSNNIFLAVAKAYKPCWIPWNSFITRFYKFMLDTTGEIFLDD